MEKYAGNWDKRKHVQHDDKYYGMYEKCRDAGRGNIEIC